MKIIQNYFYLFIYLFIACFIVIMIIVGLDRVGYQNAVE